ncbi:MAG: ABC transporter permease [Deltaproteobacteria bacterium]|nr:ABC transporter permease [Deltaproteobacteria bacterium]
MPFSLKIALRFLSGSIQSRPLSLFSLISILGISFSVLLFLFIDTLVTGLTVNLREALIGFEAPLILEVSADAIDKTDDRLKSFFKEHQLKNIRHTGTREFEGLIQVPGDPPTGVRARTVQSDFFLRDKGGLEIFWLNDYTQEIFLKGDNLILVGEKLFERLKFLPGDEEIIQLTHPFADIGPSGEIEPVQREFKIAGIFATGRVDFDDAFVLLTDDAMTGLASDLMVKNRFFIFPDDVQQADVIKRLWNKSKGGSLAAMMTWYDKNKNVYRAMQLEKLMYAIIFVFVLMISCFNLAGVISIFELSKAVPSAVLRAMGLGARPLRMIYIFLGLIMGGAGTVLGMVTGLCLITLLKVNHFSLPKVYGFTELPLTVSPATVLFLLIGTPLIAGIVSFFPTIRLAKRSVARVLSEG